MKPRHAAALALVGWYLMMPPIPPKGSTPMVGVDAQAPLSKWTVSSGFDTAAACHVAHGKLLDDAAKLGNPKELEVIRIQVAMADSQCIATDDPRLKEK